MRSDSHHPAGPSGQFHRRQNGRQPGGWQESGGDLLSAQDGPVGPARVANASPRELRAGLFEAIKCAIIGDPALFKMLSKNRRKILQGKPAALAEVIRACAALKALVVSKDEKEGDLRRVLNFGHTVGHALEVATEYRRFLHGEAVAWGMLAATRLAMASDGLASADAERITDLICSYGPVPSLGKIAADDVCRHMAVDKKVRDGMLHFVLPRRIGEVTIVKVISPDQVAAILDDLRRTDPFRASRPKARRVSQVHA